MNESDRSVLEDLRDSVLERIEALEGIHARLENELVAVGPDELESEIAELGELEARMFELANPVPNETAKPKHVPCRTCDGEYCAGCGSANCPEKERRVYAEMDDQIARANARVGL